MTDTNNQTDIQKRPLISCSPIGGVAAMVLMTLASFSLGVVWVKGFNPSIPFLDKYTNTAAAGTPAAKPATATALDNLTDAAKKAGVDTKKFETCVANKEGKATVDAQMAAGTTLGIKGTPGGWLVNVKTNKAVQLRGAVDYATLQADIKGLIAGTTDTASLYTGTLPTLAKEDHITGAKNPTVILFEYSDYECPFCRRFHPTSKQALDEFKNEFALVYRHFPLESIHPKARPAAEAAECVAKLGGDTAFWKFTNYIFEN